MNKEMWELIDGWDGISGEGDGIAIDVDWTGYPVNR